jgi:hypothetical protein
MTPKTKQILIAIVIIIVSFIGYKMSFVSEDSGSVALVADQTNNSEFVDGQIILNLLDKLNNVTLDESIFSNNIFVSLVSFERPIESQVSGRPNPFLPIGVDGAGTVSPRSTSTPAAR